MRAAVFFFSLLFYPAFAYAVPGVDCSLAVTAIKIASRLRGLPVKRSVPCKLQDKAQVERYLLDAIDKKVPVEVFRGEERVYKLLGLIPGEFDYKGGLVKLYTDQLGGYYDSERDYYAMAAWMPKMMQMPIAVHELTHALQDQHYDLDELMEYDELNSDELMAHLALLEGDATAVMIDYARSLRGEGSISKEESVSAFMLQNAAGAAFSPSLRTAPPGLQAMLLFPYISGLNFVHSRLRSGGYGALSQVYAKPPSSTEEILHPEKFGKSDFRKLDNPLPPSGITVVSEKPMFSDRLGEFVISTMLSYWIEPLKASSAATGWGGDRVSLYDTKANHLGLVVWISHWDTEGDAEEFFEALCLAYSKRFSLPLDRGANHAQISGTEIGSVRIELKSDEVLVVLGGS